MTEPAEEQPDPHTIARPEPVPSGGRQDDSQSPFFTTDFGAIQRLKNKTKTPNEQKQSN